METFLSVLKAIGSSPRTALEAFGGYNLLADVKLSFLTGALVFLLCVLLPYLVGSINTAVVISRGIYGKDIRTEGSKNAGMTNMFRVFGKRAGVLTLIGDLLKAIISVLIGMVVLGNSGGYVAGLFCILGHVFPIYFRFKGGKGVLVAAATVLCTNPAVFIFLIVIFAVVLLVGRMVSLASITAACFYPLVLNFYSKSCLGLPPDVIALAFSIFAMVMILVFHRSNIVRIWNMEEHKIGSGGKSKK